MYIIDVIIISLYFSNSIRYHPPDSKQGYKGFIVSESATKRYNGRIMRRKLLAIGVLAIGIVIIFAVSHLFGSKKPSTPTLGTQADICVQFITDIEKNDAKSSYALFSTRLKGIVDYAAWQSQLPSLNATFSNIVPTFDKQVTINATTTNPESLQRTYTIDNFGTKYSMVCFLSVTNKTIYNVDGYSVQPKGS